MSPLNVLISVLLIAVTTSPTLSHIADVSIREIRQHTSAHVSIGVTKGDSLYWLY